MLNLQAITPVRSEAKSWEGRNYVRHSASFLVQLTGRDGSTFPEAVRLTLNDDDAKLVKPGSTYTLAPTSFYLKDGKLSFSPKLLATTAGGGSK